ncbi:MAG: thymidine phosphorylase [Nanoarchaeota archaeon]
MKFKVHYLDLATGGSLVVALRKADAKHLDAFSGDRVLLKHGNKEVVCILDLAESKKELKEGSIGLFEEVLSRLGVKSGDIIDVKYTGKPKSVNHIREKLFGKKLSYQQLYEIADDITNDRLTQIEKTYFVSAYFAHGFTLDETVNLTKALVFTGNKLKFGKLTLDKHCLSGDTPVIIKNSSKVKIKGIGEIIDNAFESNAKDIVWKNGAEYLTKNPKNIQVLTFGDDGIVKFVSVTGFFRVKSPPKMQEITLIGNRTVKVTPDHTVFILRKGKIINIPASILKCGDHVIVPSGIKNMTKPITEIKVDLPQNGRFKVVDTLHITPEFMRLLGYYVSEGFTNEQGIFFNFGSHEKELIEETKSYVKKVFGFESTINIPHPTAVRVTVYSKQLAQLFKEKMDAGCNALEKKIPSFVFDLSRELQLEFLQALFNGDGYVRRGYEAIYVTASKQLSTDLQYLLSLLGMSVSLSISKKGRRKFPTRESDVAESYYVYTQAREIFGEREKPNVSYLNLLPTTELGEINKLKIKDYEMKRAFRRNKYITKENLRKCLDALTSSDIKKIINGNLSVLPVKRNEEVEANTSFVYDFYVEGYNKFMAGTAPLTVHNCIGGVPGNRTTMVVIPIIAAAGFTIPKTSSRAITSPAGTADTMECLARVELPPHQIIEVVKKTGACIVHGGSMNLAPADDKIIEVERPLSIDAEGQLLASVLAKKHSVSANLVLIDIPMGKSCKAKNLKEAKHLQKMFEVVGKKLGMKVKVVITDGSHPIGYGIGPLFESDNVMSVLRNEARAPSDLKNKAIFMAGLLLEMTGKYKKGEGAKKAKEILESGKALTKMEQIIHFQGAEKKVSPGKFTFKVFAPKSGKIVSVDNEIIARIARISGNPEDKGAGLILVKNYGDKVNKGDLLYTVYAHGETKIGLVKEVLKEGNGYTIR